MKIERNDFLVLEAGTYVAKIARIEAAEGKFGPQLQWDFDLEGGGSIRAWCGASLTPKSKLFGWVKALLGNVPDELETDDLVGLPCRLMITVRTRDDGTETNRVETILPVRQQQRRTTPAPEPATENMPF